MKFDVLCPEGQMCDYPFEKPCRTNMLLDFRTVLTAVHKRNTSRLLVQDLDMITGVD